MVKQILLLLVFATLAHSSTQAELECYNCKTPDLQSSRVEFNELKLCDKDVGKWPKKAAETLGFPYCKKLLEKVTVDGKEEILTIRTIGKEKMELDSKFTEYTCNTNLCNSAVTVGTTTFLAFLSVVIAIASTF